MTEVDHKTGKKPRQHKKKQTDYDTPWKDAIEFYFRDVMDFYFPEQALAMDWSKPCRFLKLNQQLWQALTQTLETATMPYVSSFERYAIQKGMDIGKQLGIEQGMEQGMEQGLLQGERAVLLRLITKRFGTLPPQFEQRLMQANQTQLECWADRVLEARSVDTVFADLPETE